MSAEIENSQTVKLPLEYEERPQEIVLPVGVPRFVILHFHIFKNAGSTIEYVLHRAFGERCVAIHGQNPDCALTADTLRDYLNDNPNIAALTSHHVRYPKPVIPYTVIFDICFFRDPLQRFFSYYKHLRRANVQDQLSDLARKLDPSRFFEMLIEDHPEVVNDSQVVTIANAGEYTRPPNRADLARAVEIVQAMAFPGVVDSFDMSLIAAEYFLHPAFPQLQLQYVKKNVGSQNDDETSASSLPEFRAKLGDKVFKKMQDLNRLDYELVTLARTEVKRRYDLVPSLNRRIEDFNARCRRLQKFYDGADF